ncbi:hypothetical protein ATO6_04760 [Oceanicola sp. 22II-s10i]|uniref:Nmad3 family putative nucleotide modification protein n=1 Tax=Oceanicola sp. 22II-s10i TaxID=1317116 RepID=UPI000B6CBC86|nr:hypothetical protein [Oceanicola sp. 22II-s10i]OWU86166.1 hypothetical protein ATO6_04760 [Oceanicola sp. 22II-s10i]
MRIIFSRKGVDSAAGGCASPIVDGRLLSLPIPAPFERSLTTYDDLGLGDLIERQSRGRVRRDALAHADPEFHAGRVAFGQTGAALSHLENQGVGPGDVFLFFGVFDHDGRRDHRIFGWMRIEAILSPADADGPRAPLGGSFAHPHTLAGWGAGNTIYVGPGACGAPPDPALCLTAPGAALTDWRVPGWLRDRGLSYHGAPGRWTPPDRLRAVARGQEFVTDVTGHAAAAFWLENVIERISAG